MTEASKTINFVPAVSVEDTQLQTETVYIRLFATFSYPEDATTEDQMRLVESGGTLDFWNDPGEGIYDETGDGL